MHILNKKKRDIFGLITKKMVFLLQHIYNTHHRDVLLYVNNIFSMIISTKLKIGLIQFDFKKMPNLKLGY